MPILHHQLLLIILVHFSEAVIVCTRYGKVRGTCLDANKKTIVAFTGIPYAKPPIGDLRFQPPQKVESWSDVRDCTQTPPPCIQTHHAQLNFHAFGSEDCLYLNVYTPKMHDIERHLPVMVFIHGGGFHSGSGNINSFHPKYIVRRNVILVTINYRLGALGFLATGDGYISGNNGLKDQNMALRWVKENIQEFGGDKQRITLFGQSTGAANVHMHVLSPHSRDLFQRAIMQSGTAFCPWALHTQEQAANLAKRLARIVNCPCENSDTMIKCLMKKKAKTLVQATKKLLEWDIDPWILFRPVVELDCDNQFFTEWPEDTLSSGQFTSNMSLIIGMNSDEAAWRVAAIDSHGLWSELDKNPAYLMNIIAPMKDTCKHLRHYFPSTLISGDKHKLVEYLSDAMITLGVDKAIMMHKAYTQQLIYCYVFGFHSSTSFSMLFGPRTNPLGVSQYDELLYLFPHPEDDFPQACSSPYDRKMVKIMTKLWVSFARCGAPYMGNALGPNCHVQWRPVSTPAIEYLEIDNPYNIAMEKELWPDRLQYWRGNC